MTYLDDLAKSRVGKASEFNIFTPPNKPKGLEFALFTGRICLGERGLSGNPQLNNEVWIELNSRDPYAAETQEMVIRSLLRDHDLNPRDFFVAGIYDNRHNRQPRPAFKSQIGITYQPPYTPEAPMDDATREKFKIFLMDLAYKLGFSSDFFLQ